MRGRQLSSMLAAALAAFAAIVVAQPAHAAPGDTVTVLYVNGVATTLAQANADRSALASALQGSQLRAGYPEQIGIENEYNPTNGTPADVAELVALKINEEHYLGRLWHGFLAGSDAPAALDTADLINIVDTRLPLDPEPIRTAVQHIVDRWTPLLQQPNRKLVLVGHSQGNFIVNWALLGLLKNLGDVALQRVRVVNVASSTVWSPSGLDVTLAEDKGVFSFLPKQGLGVPRSTPFCDGAACAFRTGTATVDANGPCTTALARSGRHASEAATLYCHNFRASYLSDLATTAVPTQRLAVAAYEREGPSIKQRLIDATFTAIDAMNGTVPAAWQDNLFGDLWGLGATASGTDTITLQAPAGVARAAAIGKRTFDQGLQASWSGCLSARSTGSASVLLDMQPRDGALAESASAPTQPLWAVGFGTTRDRRDTLLAVFGQSALPIYGNGTEVQSRKPARTGNAFCGTYSLAIGADGRGSARFVNALDGAMFDFASTLPVTPGVKRLNLHASGNAVVTVQGLSITPTPFAPPFP